MKARTGFRSGLRQWRPGIYTKTSPVWFKHLSAIWGGDEFAMLLTNTSKESVENVVSKLCQSLAKYNQEAKRGYDITFSHGSAEFDPEKLTTIETMLADGDLHMYVKWSCFLGQFCGLAKMHLISVHAAFRVSAWPKYAMSGVRLSRAV